MGVLSVCASAPARERVWIRQFGTSGHEEARALAPAPGGDVYIAGETNGMLGSTRNGLPDPWLARYDIDGTRVWIRQFGGNWPESAWAWALTPDGAGGVYISGDVNGTIMSPPMSFGGHDGWLARFNETGDRLWIRQFGTDAVDYLGTILSDGHGGFFACGATYGSLARPHHFGADAWIGRFDGNGVGIWIIQFGVSTDDWAWCMAPDDAGGFYVGGWTRGNIGAPPAGERDAWVARYNGDSTRFWARQFGSAETDETRALAPDGAGGVFVTGRTWGTIAPPHTGDSDVWIARLSASGDVLHISQFGSGTFDRVHAMIPDQRGGALLAGTTIGRFGSTTGGGYDAWLGRFGCYADCDQSTGVGVLDIFDFLCSARISQPAASTPATATPAPATTCATFSTSSVLVTPSRVGVRE